MSNVNRILKIKTKRFQKGTNRRSLMRIIATNLLLVFATTFAWTQTEVILEYNAAVTNAYKKEHSQFMSSQVKPFGTAEKSLCTEAEDGLISILSGEGTTVTLDIDTFSLGANGAYECLNCNELSFGTGEMVLNADGTQSEVFSYTSFGGIDVGIDTVQIQYCNADTCSEIEEIAFLVRRAGVSYYPADINVNQEEAAQAQAVNNLPGDLKCNFFIDCPDQYEGRDQIAYFTDYTMVTNEIVYKASRFSGVDSVCVVLCDEYGICDSTHFAFRLSVPSVAYPFYEDFYSDNPYPESSHWLDKEVFVNQQLSRNPKSIGIATFDGIDNRGRPYDEGFGESDRLTSTYIDIPNTATSPTLSFWAQRGGYADRPEVKDSLVVQFKNQGGDWVSMLSLEGVPSNVHDTFFDPFQFYSIVLEPGFQYDKFQFRFLAHSDGTGFRDNWNLDYIRLDNNPVGDSIFNDISFTEKPNFLLNNYTSMPWRHFQSIADTELKSTVDIGVYNHFSTGQNMSPSSLIVEEENTGINPIGQVPTLFNGTEINVENGVIIKKNYSLMGDATGFSNVWADYMTNMTDSAFDDLDKVSFEMEYNLQNNSQNSVDFVDANDRVSRVTEFSDYFAYDDGTAERGFSTFAGAEVAVAFSAAVADTIRGVRVNFPFTGKDFEEQEFRLKIWTEEEGLGDNPIYNEVYQPVVVSSFFDTLHSLTSLQLFDEEGEPTVLAIPAGIFYVGWEQKSTCAGCKVVFGYDSNRQGGYNYTYVNNGLGWEPTDLFREGSIIIRPVVGGDEPIGATAVEETNKEELGVSLFPNPSNGMLYFSSDQLISDQAIISVFNSTGQLLSTSKFQKELDLRHLPGGMYLVKIIDADTQKISIDKVMIMK